LQQGFSDDILLNPPPIGSHIQYSYEGLNHLKLPISPRFLGVVYNKIPDLLGLTKKQKTVSKTILKNITRKISIPKL